MARIAPTSYDPAPNFDLRRALDERIPFEEWEDTKAMKALMDASRALPEGEVKGGVIRFPVADGYAHYLVTSARPLTLQHIYYGDAWTVPDYMLTGLTKANILEMLRRERALAAIFGQA